MGDAQPYGAQHWPMPSYAEVVAQRNEANARIDSALAEIDRYAVMFGDAKMLQRIRRTLTGDTDD